ncbi:MAG: hypothetical protein K2I68_07140, partial [Bacteroidales bacterium]|nr:hypothetical protein [Bacteroidales bacterium]
MSEKEYAQLSQLFAADVLLKDDAAKNFAAYKSKRSLNVYSHKCVLNIKGSQQASQSLKKILVIVDSTIYSKLRSKIERYAYDINNVYDCDVVME